MSSEDRTQQLLIVCITIVVAIGIVLAFSARDCKQRTLLREECIKAGHPLDACKDFSKP